MFLVRFSCKGQRVCPLCNGRRTARTAAHIVDRVILPAPFRQWVISVPKRFQCFLADCLKADATRTTVLRGGSEWLLSEASGVWRVGNAPNANRSAVVGRCRKAFRDWLRSIGVEEEEFEDHGDESVYLMGECEYPEDREEVLRESSSAIFYEEVSAWHLDSEQYPDFNDFTLFTEWFETEFFGMVSDALDEPLTKSE